jgi:REP element-mobilizing transposase RayT
MTYPRSHTVPEHEGACFHVYSRCVRRAWLFRQDAFGTRDLSHRAGLLETRLIELASCFSISIFSYAVMSNHYHLVVKTEPKRALSWSAHEVARRWLACSGSRINLMEDSRQLLDLVLNLSENKEKVEIARTRLSSLSWFIRKVNEPIARLANAEDGCTGRFWEGRFKSQVLLDEAAVLSCMAYVDLNPVRAGFITDIEKSSFTSINRRLRISELGEPLDSIDGNSLELPYPEISLGAYLAELKMIAGFETNPSSLLAMGIQPPDQWLRAIGSKANMKTYATKLGQSWLNGPKE